MPDQRNRMTATTGNRPLAGLADRARQLADTHPYGSVDRSAALVVAVAAREMTTPARARALIVEHFAGRPGNADIERTALGLLDQLTLAGRGPDA